MNRKLARIALHLVLWIAVWFYFYYFFSYNSSDRAYVIWFSSLLLPLTMALSYFAIFFLIPRYLFPKEYGRFALYSFYTLLASAYFIVLIIYGCMFINKGFNLSAIPPMIKNFFFILILVYLVVGLISFITILNRNFHTEKQNKDLQNMILSAQLQFKEQELSYLKKQIHPHFLFNTLNTIYGLALKQSEHTPAVILKLSNLLDYILYQIDKPRVSLAEEVEHIREYIGLEKIRFRDSLKVNFPVSPIDENIQVPPMILIPFVENAFKHGELVEGCLHIKMELRVTDSELHFRIANSIHKKEREEVSSGLGLENFRKRMDLIYRDNYKLSHEYSETWYSASLHIPDLKLISHE